jgi:hypothetical protein
MMIAALPRKRRAAFKAERVLVVVKVRPNSALDRKPPDKAYCTAQTLPIAA